ncbi:MAG: ATP-binding protein [Verrucomicrobia bacterium]|nr:ATP-binding protein [Verrucomicrobiota bacterium]
MIHRLAEARVSDLLERFPAVAVLGPRQVGKTTLALRLADDLGPKAVYLDLELPSHRAKLSDPELYLNAQEDRLVIFDELQRQPGLFEVLRGIIDGRRRSGRRTGQFLLLGSASIDLLRQTSETLAGRIAYLELTPLLVEEVVAKKRSERDRLWLRGGFPDSFLADDDAASVEWREAFIGTYLERDIPSLGPRIPAETLRRFWTMLAHEQGTLLNAAAVAAGLGVSGQTVGRYLDLMVDLLLVRRLQPWSANAGKRLVRSPKVYVRDSGLVHALLGLRDLDAVLGHPVTGGSWEGFVIENLLAAAPAGTQAWFYRTAAGAEIDLVLEIPPKQRWAIEIKRSSAPSLAKGFYLGCKDVKATRRMVVHAGEETYGLGDGVEAASLAGALAELRRS